MPEILARDVLVNRRGLDRNVRISTTLLCAWCLNPTTHEYQVSVASDIIYMYILVLTILKICYCTKRKRKRELAKFNPKNRNFTRKQLVIFNRLLRYKDLASSPRSIVVCRSYKRNARLDYG